MQDDSTQLWLAPPGAAARLEPARLHAADRARWRALRGPARRGEWEASRALLTALALPRGCATSLSHSGGFAAMAVVSAGHRVGVDLQRIGQRDVLRLAQFAFSPAEVRQIAALPEEPAREHFHVLWVLKEAFGKALGLPLTQALRECCFVKRDMGWQARVPAEDAWQAVVLAPRAELVLAAVVLGQRRKGNRVWSCGEWPGSPTAEWPQLARFRSQLVTACRTRSRSPASCPRSRLAPGH